MEQSQKLDPQIPNRMHHLVLLAGGLAITGLEQWLRATVQPEFEQLNLAFFWIGVVCFLAGLWCLERGSAPIWVERLFTWAANVYSGSRSQILHLLFSLVFSCSALIAAGMDRRMSNPWAALTSWSLAILCVIAASVQNDGEHKPSLKISGAVWWALLIFLLALPARVISTATIPVVLSGDEGSSGLFSTGILRGDFNNPFVVGWFSFPSLYFFFQSAGIRLIGQTSEGLRIPSGIIGALTVSALFLTARAMYNTRTAVFASILLALAHLHLNFSRIGLNNIWDGFSLVAVIGLFWWGYSSGKRTAYLFAGLLLGLAQYMYTSSKVLNPILLVWQLLVIVFDRQRPARFFSDSILMWLSALVVFLPLAIFYTYHPDEFFAPMQRVTILGDWLSNESINTGLPSWRILLGQFWLSLLSFTELPLRSWYNPGVPMLRPAQATLFIVGLAAVIMRPKQKQSWLLALWLAAFMATIALSESTPAGQRMVGVIPACAIIMALGLDRLIELSGKLLPDRSGLIAGAAILICLLISLDDARFYFFDFTPKSDFSGVNGEIAQHVANTLNADRSIRTVVFSGAPNMNYDSVNSLLYLAPGVTGISLQHEWGSPEDPDIPAGDKLFIFLPNHENDEQKFLQEHPGAQLTLEKDHNGQLLYFQLRSK